MQLSDPMIQDLMLIVLILFIVILIDLVVAKVVKTYNKMVLKKNELVDNYQNLTKEINFRFELTRQYIPIIQNRIDQNTVNYLNNLISSHSMKVDVNDIANDYYILNNLLYQIDKIVKAQGFSAPEWDKAFNDSIGRIEASRVLYDDNVLKMNEMVDIPPSNLVAKMFGVSKWVYFRNA